MRSRLFHRRRRRHLRSRLFHRRRRCLRERLFHRRRSRCSRLYRRCRCLRSRLFYRRRRCLRERPFLRRLRCLRWRLLHRHLRAHAASSSPPLARAPSLSPLSLPARTARSPLPLLLQLLDGTSARVLAGNATLACASLTLSAVAPTLTLRLPNGTTTHTFAVLAAPAVAPPTLPSLPELAASLSPLLAVSLPHFESGITDDDFECTLASCCGHSISLPFDAPARRDRFISSGRCPCPCHVTAPFLCFGQEGLHPTSSSVSLLCCGQEGLHLTSTSGNFSQTPFGSGQGTAVCSPPSASGHHNPVTFCNLLRFLSTITDSFTSLDYIALESTTTNGFCMPATAFNALPCTAACISLFAFAILLLVSISVFSCAAYALRTRFSMLGANINCRNSVHNNVSSNVGVFDFFKSVPWEHRVLYRSTDRYQLPWPVCSDLRRRLCLFSHLAVSIRL